MAGFAIQEGPELLPGPLCGRMVHDVDMQDSTRSDLDSNKYARDMKVGRHGREKVAGDDLTGMILDKGRPSLAAGWPRSFRLLEIFAHGAGIDQQADLQ